MIWKQELSNSKEEKRYSLQQSSDQSKKESLVSTARLTLPRASLQQSSKESQEKSLTLNGPQPIMAWKDKMLFNGKITQVTFLQKSMLTDKEVMLPTNHFERFRNPDGSLGAFVESTANVDKTAETALGVLISGRVRIGCGTRVGFSLPEENACPSISRISDYCDLLRSSDKSPYKDSLRERYRIFGIIPTLFSHYKSVYIPDALIDGNVNIGEHVEIGQHVNILGSSFKNVDLNKEGMPIPPNNDTSIGNGSIFGNRAIIEAAKVGKLVSIGADVKIICSDIEDCAIIRSGANLVGSKIGTFVKIGKLTMVINSKIGSNAFIGDVADITKSKSVPTIIPYEDLPYFSKSLDGSVKLERSEVGNGVCIGCDSVIEESHIGNNVRIGKRVNIKYATIEDDVYIGDGSQIDGGAIIRHGAKIGKSVHVYHRVKVGSGQKILDHSTPSRIVTPDKRESVYEWKERPVYKWEDKTVAKEVFVGYERYNGYLNMHVYDDLDDRRTRRSLGGGRVPVYRTVYETERVQVPTGETERVKVLSQIRHIPSSISYVHDGTDEDKI